MEIFDVSNLEEGNLIEIVGHPLLDNGTIRRVNRLGSGELYFMCGDYNLLVDQNLQDMLNSGTLIITRCYLRF